jgi:hypothetical protein
MKKWVAVCWWVFAVAIILYGVVGGFALAAETQPGKATEPGFPSGVDMSKIGDILIKFLVLSVIFESALTPIFNWRIFLEYFDEKGLKTPITVILALLTFWVYDLDIFREVLVSFGLPDKSGFVGKVITALLIAGGSNGVLTIFDKLHIRDLKARKTKAGEARAQLQARKESKPHSG